MSLSDVRITVPKLDRPALTFEKLTIALDKVDIVKQHAAVEDVTLLAAHVVVDPKSKQPLPFLVPPPVEEEPTPLPKTATRSAARPRRRRSRGPGP